MNKSIPEILLADRYYLGFSLNRFLINEQLNIGSFQMQNLIKMI